MAINNPATFTSMDDYMQQAKRLFNAGNIAYNALRGLNDAAEKGAGSNNEGIDVKHVVDEKFVSQTEVATTALEGVLTSAVFGILEGAAAAARGAPPGMAQATQAMAKAQVNEVVKRFKEQAEKDVTDRAAIAYERNLAKAGEDIAKRLSIDLASTKETSEEVKKAQDDALYTKRVGPKDPSTMNLGTA